MSKYRRFRKPRYCPNASSLGYSRPYVSEGDFISYREAYLDGSDRTRLARVLGLVTHDGCGNAYPQPRLFVMATDDMLSHGMERHVALEDVADVRTPGAFTRWFLFGKMPAPELALRFMEYGAASNSYAGEYLTEPEGELDPEWHEIAMRRKRAHNG